MTYAKEKLVEIGDVSLYRHCSISVTIIRGRKINHPSVDYVYGQLRFI